MPKAKEKMVPIRVTARFEVTFIHKVTESQFEEMDKNKLEVSDVVDESIPYGLVSSEGECEMEWDYGPPPPKALKPPKAKKPKKK
jgi:hypothetical protein